jgi:hypothetical protein
VGLAHLLFRFLDYRERRELRELHFMLLVVLVL